MKNRNGYILCIDYGKKKCGLAVTDISQIIAQPLGSVDESDLLSYLKKYQKQKEFSTIVLGYPLSMDGSKTDMMKNVDVFEKKLRYHFPHIEISKVDERFTSRMSKEALKLSESKKKRRSKDKVHQIAATLILQSYLEAIEFKILKNTI